MQLAYGRRCTSAIATAVVTLVCLLASARAGAAITVGSDLGRTPDISYEGNAGALTVADSNIYGGVTLDRQYKYRSPVNGTVVAWSIRTGDTDTGPVSFRVLSPGRYASLGVGALAAQQFGGVQMSATETPALNGISSFPTHLPILRGQQIGLDCCAPGSPGQYFVDTTSPDHLTQSELYLWEPPLSNDGSQRTISDFDYDTELAINAAIEPDSSFSVSSIQPANYQLNVAATFPNAGTLTAGDPGVTLARSHRKHRRRVPHSLLNATSVAVPAPATTAPAPVTSQINSRVNFAVGLTTAARRFLRTQGRLQVPLRITYTPDFGQPSTQTLQESITAHRVRRKRRSKRG